MKITLVASAVMATIIVQMSLINGFISRVIVGTRCTRQAAWMMNDDKNSNRRNGFDVPISVKKYNANKNILNALQVFGLTSVIINVMSTSLPAIADSARNGTNDAISIDYGEFKLPYNHENIPLKEFFGRKATIIFNMKIDDPQTSLQFADLNEIYNKYASKGLSVLAFPTEQGWFEPDDDETVRAKMKDTFNFGTFPSAVVFDKVDLLGPSACPLYSALTKNLLTPNGYGRITLNYEKFLLDSKGMCYLRTFS